MSAVPTTTTTDCLLDVKEVANLLHVSKRQVWRWIAAKQFPAPIKLGARTMRWRREVVQAWIISQEPQPVTT